MKNFFIWMVVAVGIMVSIKMVSARNIDSNKLCQDARANNDNLAYQHINLPIDSISNLPPTDPNASSVDRGEVFYDCTGSVTENFNYFTIGGWISFSSNNSTFGVRSFLSCEVFPDAILYHSLCTTNGASCVNRSSGKVIPLASCAIP